MAESAEDTVKVADVAREEETTAAETTNGEAKGDVDAVTEAHAGGATEDAAEKADQTETAETADAAKENDAPAEQDSKDTAEESTSRSPDHKRKDPPVSISAHDRDDRKRSRGGYGGRFASNKSKARFEDQPESNDPDEIRRQVEFYFSDSNLPIDAYLLDQTGGHKNRPVPLKVIHNFKRMRHFQPYAAVRDAVKDSRFLNLSDDDEITRKEPLSDKFTDDPNKNRTLVHTSSMSRSIYAKGFGDETKTTHLDIEAFFAPYGPINSVRLRRKDDGDFKGSVFVEFGDDDGAQRFLDLNPKPQFEGRDLEIMSKQEYVDMKHQGIIDGDVKPRSPDRSNPNRGGGGYRGRGRDRRDDNGGSREHGDKDDWRARRDRDNGRERGGRGRGGRGGRGRGGRGRGDRGGRRRSPDFRDRDRNRRRRDEDDGERADEGESRPPKRAEAEAEKATNGGDEGGNEKKRAREDDGEHGGEAKKAKADAEA